MAGMHIPKHIFDNNIFVKIIISKTLLIIFFMILIASCIASCATDINAADFWSIQPSPTKRNLTNVFFINNNTGWISGDSGTIIKTTNAGASWDIQNSGTLVDIQAFFFINERLGWAIGWEIAPDSNSYLGTRILKTTNGGTNWISYMYSVANYFMKTIYFLDSAKGFMAGAPLSIVLTTDAGASWNNVDTDTSLVLGFPVENIKFINPLIGYAAGGFRDLAGSMWRTTNGGLNWLATVVGPEPLNDLYIFNSSKVIAAGGDFEFGSSTVKTNDGGANWFYTTLGVFGVANSIDFRTQYEGWISLGSAQKFVYTLDSGNTWTNIFAPDSASIYDIQFIDSLHGWAAGYNGVILKYNIGTVNINNINDIISPNTFSLYQNYPNPFNPNTSIIYELKSKSNVSVKVYDIDGREIVTLADGLQSPGKYSLTFNGENLPSGVYFYELHAQNFSETKKMLLLK